MPEPSPADLLACAVAAATQASAHAVRQRHRRRETVRTYRHDVKLKLDQECQEIAEGVIRQHFPRHAFLGEETADQAGAPGDTPAAGDHLWIVDPIDGTVNFSHGLRQWCCSVAVMKGDATLAGAVCAPELDEQYTAAADAPALCNGRPIAVSDTPDLASAIVMTGLDKQAGANLAPLALFNRIAVACRKTRVMGSAALDICSVACGRADGYFEAGIFIWDIAAAALIVRQASGRIETLRRMDRHRQHFLATNGRVHEELKALVSVD